MLPSNYAPVDGFGVKRFPKEIKLSKYISAFDYFDNSSIVLSATSGGVSIAWFASVIGASIGIEIASFSFMFSIASGIVKKLLKTTWYKTKSIIKLSC